MKKSSLSLLFTLLVFTVAFSQVPNAFNYQAVVRSSSGAILADQDVSFKISILQDSELGSVVYSETQTLTTNSFGLANFEIGSGNNKTGTFSPAGWGTSPHFIKIEFDPAGGTSFTHLSTSKMASVPYAFHAQTVTEVDDADADPANEIQTLAIKGNDLFLSDGGGTVALPTSPWIKSIGFISYNLGSVGIGTKYPKYMLDIQSTENAGINVKSTLNSAYVVIDRPNKTRTGNLSFKTDGSIKFRTGLLFNSDNYRISSDYTVLKGLEVEEDGDVVISNELHTNATGNANLIPIAYGTISQSGNVVCGSRNISATNPSVGKFEITIKDEYFQTSTYVTTATLSSIYGFIRVTGIGGKLVVYIRDHDNAVANSYFSFVVYKP